MANINITVQSLLNAAQSDAYTVADTTTIGTFKSTIETDTGCNVSWFSLVFNSQELDVNKTLAFYGITTGSYLRTANKIARLTTLEDRQVAKLELSQLERLELANTRPYYDIAELPTFYSGNVVIDNLNPDGLIEGRPWVESPPDPNANYPIPGSGTYNSGNAGLSGVTYAVAGTPYVPSGGITTVPGTPAAGLIRYKYFDKIAGKSWNGSSSPGVGTPANWDMTFPTGYPFVKEAVDTYVSWGFQTDTPSTTNFNMQWLGYFQAPVTANFNMFIISDDDSVVWVGSNALDGNYTNANFAVKTSNALTRNTNTMQLTAGKWYPIRIWFAEYQGGCNFQIFFQQADGTNYNGDDITWAFNASSGGY